MYYQKISAKLNQFEIYRLYLAAQTTIEKFVKPLPFILDHLNSDLLTEIRKDLNKESNEFYIIYDYRIADYMKQLGEPISNKLIYPIWQRTYTNTTILEDLVFQKIHAYTNHNIPLEEMKNESSI
jgi:hypothetical protein